MTVRRGTSITPKNLSCAVLYPVTNAGEPNNQSEESTEIDIEQYYKLFFKALDKDKDKNLFVGFSRHDKSLYIVGLEKFSPPHQNTYYTSNTNYTTTTIAITFEIHSF